MSLQTVREQLFQWTIHTRVSNAVLFFDSATANESKPHKFSNVLSTALRSLMRNCIVLMLLLMLHNLTPMSATIDLTNEQGARARAYCVCCLIMFDPESILCWNLRDLHMFYVRT